MNNYPPHINTILWHCRMLNYTPEQYCELVKSLVEDQKIQILATTEFNLYSGSQSTVTSSNSSPKIGQIDLPYSIRIDVVPNL